MPSKVTVIKPTKQYLTGKDLKTNIKRKVAGYARVSTDHDDQFSSYEAQIDYYTKYIQARPDWQFVDVYTDEGITGTSTKHRGGFNQMVDDALAGKIDLIVTKSVSRFARNTVDSLTTIRKLKESGVEVYFEKENIWTFDGKGELLLTIMSSLAQEESRSISQNCTWGQRKRFSDGKFSVAYSHFLGYDKGPDGGLIINEEQAKVVRRIFGMYLEGYNPHAIARILTEDKIPTPFGKETWIPSTIRSILKNEKYKGCALLQKGYTVDFLSKKYAKNNGEVAQYFVEDCHEAIIEPEVFDMVQEEIKKRKGQNSTSKDVFSGKVRCAKCGGYFGAKVWHSNDKYKKIIYRCNNEYDGCGSDVRVTEQELKNAVVEKINELYKHKKMIIAEFSEEVDKVFDITILEKKAASLDLELESLAEQLESLVKKNAAVVLNQDEYKKFYNECAEKYDSKCEQVAHIKEEILSKQARYTELATFIKNLKALKVCKEFTEKIFRSLVDHIEITEKGKIMVIFRNGLCL